MVVSTHNSASRLTCHKEKPCPCGGGYARGSGSDSLKDGNQAPWVPYPIRPTLAARFPGGIPAFSPCRSPPCQSLPGQIVALFGSPPTWGSQPASHPFPRGRNPRLVRPGGFPCGDASRERSRSSSPLPPLAQLLVARLLQCSSEVSCSSVQLTMGCQTATGKLTPHGNLPKDDGGNQMSKKFHVRACFPGFNSPVLPK
jgi:hypothetical protein